MTTRLGTPAARMAVISPSPAIRLSAMSVPTSTPSGMVKVRVNGIASKNNWATVAGDAELRTMSSNSLLIRSRNRTNVNRAAPSMALENTSRKMERLRMRMTRWSARGDSKWGRLPAQCHLTFPLTEAYTEFVGQPLGLRPAPGRPVPVNRCLILPVKSGSGGPTQAETQAEGLPHVESSHTVHNSTAWRSDTSGSCTGTNSWAT
jgi:hypothetical protein